MQSDSTYMRYMHDEIIKGWIVVRLKPWDFHGPFPTRAIAEQIAANLNANRHQYEIKWGERPASRLATASSRFGKGLLMTRRVALYVRVSTDGQTTENQRRELEIVADRHGWTVVEIFQDSGISGAKSREERPAMRQLMRGVARRDFDMVAAWSVDRLGRSLQDLVGFLGELHGKGVDLYLHQQGLDTSTPAGKAMFGMLSVFGGSERAMIVDRVKAGLRRAVGQGKTLGRPRIDPKTEAAIRAALAAGHGILKTAAMVGVGSGTVQRVRKEMRVG